MSVKIKRYLQAQYPELTSLLGQIKTVPKLKRRDMPLPEAVVRVVTGQMLSFKVAQAIYGRIKAKTESKQLLGSWLLDQGSLRDCGLSNSKARAICEFGSQIGTNIASLDHWHSLPAEKLVEEIQGYWGMGKWSASIIALAYVGHEDIFPSSDGSIQRALKIIQQRNKRKRPLSPERAAPYRSYLALYLWRGLDDGVLVDR